jgi:hypothetical protein
MPEQVDRMHLLAETIVGATPVACSAHTLRVDVPNSQLVTGPSLDAILIELLIYISVAVVVLAAWTMRRRRNR